MKRAAGMMSLLVVFALCGCMKVDQEITLNKDGSGRADIMYAMSEQTLQQMKAMAEMAKQMSQQEGQEGQAAPEEENPFEFDKAKVEEKFKALKDKGITLKSVKTEKKEGWEYMYLVFDFQDISKLKEVEFYQDSPLTITKNEAGNYEIVSQMSGEEMGGGQGEEQMKAMLPMLKGMRISMKFNTPGKIIETTAPIKEAKSAEWVYDVDKDPETFMKMSSTDMKIVFDGKGCTIPEVQ
jgi:hypothetical protein